MRAGSCDGLFAVFDKWCSYIGAFVLSIFASGNCVPQLRLRGIYRGVSIGALSVSFK